MMRQRQKQRPDLYPHWRRKRDNSPAYRAKMRDGWQCVDCGIHNRTLGVNVEGLPYIVYIHAAHVSVLDPDPIEPIEGQRLRGRCPSCHKIYDNYWRDQEAEVKHQRTLHGILISRFVMHRFMSVY